MRTRRATRQAVEEATREAGIAAHDVVGDIETNPPHMVVTTRQTRLSFRVSKTDLDGAKRGKNIPTDTTANGDADNEPPTKRRRITQASASTLSNTPAKPEPEPDPARPPKILTIKGIIIQNNVALKTTHPIAIGTTQILSPDHKLAVKRGPSNPAGLTPGFSPYPYRTTPTPVACLQVHAILTAHHGPAIQPTSTPPPSLQVAGCGEVPGVLDALMRTLISGNTMMSLANKALQNVVRRYGVRQETGTVDWEQVRLGTVEELGECVRVAGSGPTKARNMMRILEMVWAENEQIVKGEGKVSSRLSLEHLRGMSKDEAMARLVPYPGIGIKTAACVTLFCLRIPCFAVDTHVLRFCRWLGWVPARADADNCFRHCDVMVPDELKYGLHQLFIRHGQMCFRCRKATRPGTREWREAEVCPLEGLLDRGKDAEGEGEGVEGDGNVME